MILVGTGERRYGVSTRPHVRAFRIKSTRPSSCSCRLRSRFRPLEQDHPLEVRKNSSSDFCIFSKDIDIIIINNNLIFNLNELCSN